MNRPRCVVDTNVLISAALVPTGTPRRVVAWIIEHGTLVASEETLEELESRLHRRKFDRYLDEEKREVYLALIREASSPVEVSEAVEVSADPDDDKFLALALSAEADCIVSGDARHLLPLHPFRGISILRPAPSSARPSSWHSSVGSVNRRV